MSLLYPYAILLLKPNTFLLMNRNKNKQDWSWMTRNIQKIEMAWQEAILEVLYNPVAFADCYPIPTPYV